MLKAIAKKLLPKFAWAYLRSKRIDHLVKSYKNKTRTGNYGGHQLTVSIQDPLAEGWYGQDWDASHELEILKKFRLKKGAKVFDLGAHQSVVAMIFAKEVGPSGRVLAIEAIKHNYRVGCENKRVNGLEQLELVHAAVGKERGKIEFSDDLNGAIKNRSTTSQSTQVDAFTIDDLIRDHFKPDLIVMDIEGYEALALEAASSALSEPIDWLIEVHGPQAIGNFGRTVDDVLKPFMNGKYDLYLAGENSKFTPFVANSPLLKERCFLVAHHKQSESTPRA